MTRILWISNSALETKLNFDLSSPVLEGICHWFARKINEKSKYFYICFSSGNFPVFICQKEVKLKGTKDYNVTITCKKFFPWEAHGFCMKLQYYWIRQIFLQGKKMISLKIEESLAKFAWVLSVLFCLAKNLYINML